MTKIANPIQLNVTRPTIPPIAWKLAIPIILLVLLPLMCVRTIDAGQVGVVTRYGEVNRETQSGLALKLPWPVEKLYRMDTRLQKQQEEAEAASSDLQVVSATLAVNYALNREKATNVYKEIGAQYRDRVIVPAVQESFKAATAQYTASELLTKRPEVKQKALESIKARVEPYGIRIEDISIVNFSFSSDFSKSIEAKQVAAQEAERAKFNLDRAKLDAEAQNVQKLSLSQEFLQKLAIDKWDGKLPQYMGGGDSVFNIPLR
ncbi:MAG TPA: prohibitin family protein [Verrucomicrobiae bacterium]|nr:prohibitin family protein [Verrucomicrobiae bacterium]